MMLMSLNIRGLHDPLKSEWLRRLKRDCRFSFCGLQETRLTALPGDVANWWGCNNFGLEFVESFGRSGGLLSIWDKRFFQDIATIKSRYFIAVVGYWNGVRGETILVNVYAPQAPAEKALLWSKLLNLISSRPGNWVLFGDFNAVRRPDERFNSVFCPRTATDFNNFIQDAGLLDLNIGGRRFTFFSDDGCKLSKLDRYLVCSNFLSAFPSASVLALPRELSDHFPIVLRTDFLDFGPPPFRFFNSWLCRDGIDRVVISAWASFEGRGAPDRYLLDKLKHVKQAIKDWRRVEFEKENKIIHELKTKLDNLELEAETRHLSDYERDNRRVLKIKILEMENLAKLDLTQKSRVKWLCDGDENSRFFHSSLKAKNRRNNLSGLMVNGVWTTDCEEIKLEAWRFFGDKFKETCTCRPLLISDKFKVLSDCDRNFLETPFDIREIKEAIWNCGGDKAPGPDGFTFKFIKRYWDLMKDDIMRFVKHFEDSGSFSRGSNSSFISLLPKVKDPLTLTDFRPISLIGCIYKIIAKTLATRFKRVIDTVIDVSQSAFIHGRNILDGPMIINEVCAWAKKAKVKSFMFKVDFDKAFDSINWNYLDSTMHQMGFGDKWRRWIRGCLSSSRASVIINGSASKEFPLTKGVRQGDPLSPFLFIIVMEGLNVAMKTACQLSLFNGIEIPNAGPSISHLFYADDAMFLGNWTSSNFSNLARILRCFHASSGLKVNFHKSKVFGIGVSDSEIARCARILGCEAAGLPFKYLGIPVGANMSLKRNWQPVVEKLQNKLSDWKAKALSFGGRLTLIKAVMGSLPLYYFSIFKAPRSITDLLEKLRRKFLWGGTEEKNKICWVPWNVVLGPKDKGGLGVGSFYALNLALLMKWFWRFKNEPSSLWRRVVCGIHNSHQKPVVNLAKKTLSGVWFRILKIIPELDSLGFDLPSIFEIKIGSGKNTLFWLDNWLGGGSLDGRFPTLFELDKKKKCFVADRVTTNQPSWDWKKIPKSLMEITELIALSDLLNSINISGTEDKWRSKLSNDGVYYVHDLRHLIDTKVTISVSNPTVWLHLVPLKIICFVWRACMDRIPSAMALARRGIHVGNTSCALCNVGSDEADHFLVNCPFTTVTMKWIFNWCGVQIQPFNTVSDFINFAATWGHCPKKRKIFIAICYGLLWCTWKARNGVVFNKVLISPFNLADNIVTLVFSFIAHRGNFGMVSWANWLCCPFNIL